jgi:7-cyano-7-deazaguanine synthase
MKRAIVLLSGGLDSAVTAAMARAEGFALHALTFDYGQRHAREMECARNVARSLGVVEHVMEKLDLRVFGGSALTADVSVPKHGDTPPSGRIPITYVPARNTIFLSVALAFAEVRGSRNIFLGVNAVDYSGYPDCRPEFLAAFERLANVATRAGVEGEAFTVQAPLVRLSKAAIVREGVRLGVDFSLTHSCYDPLADGRACGHCESCVLRREGFRQAGVSDPAEYESH